MGWVVNSMPRPLYQQETDPVPLIQEAEWAQWSVRKGVENPAPNRDSIPERQLVASRHTDCSTTTHKITYIQKYIFIFLSVYIMSWCPHLGQILRQLAVAHNRSSRLGFNQYTPHKNKKFWEYFLRIICFKYFNVYGGTIREYLLGNYVFITFYTQFKIIQDSATWNLRDVSLQPRCEWDLRCFGMLRS